MTSGEFTRVPVNKIWVIRGERQRSDIKESEVKELSDSIRRLGLIHPLVIDREYRLWAGERRLIAVKMLNHDFVMCQWLDELDPLKRIEVEFEENVKRVDLTWQDQKAAMIKHYETAKQLHGKSWREEDTAARFGVTQRTVSDYRLISEEEKRNPSILNHAEKNTALNILRRDQERRDAARMEGVFAIPQEEKVKSIVTADFCIWASTYTGPKFNFLHCDFPYGIETDRRHQGTAVAIHGGYDDSADTYWKLLTALCDNLPRLCTESAHIMFWFSMHYYADTLDFFANHSDFVIDPFPLVWMKSDGKGLLPDPQRGPRRIYETCLFGSRGDRKIVSSVANAYAAPTDSKGHLSAKPEPVLRHFFRMFVDENSTVLDPTCGGGSALRAAESLDAALVVGVEINGEFAERATLALEVSRRLRRATA